MSKYQKLFAFVIILAIAAAYACWKVPMSRGLDIAGGMRVVMQVAPKSNDDWPSDLKGRQEKLASIKKTIEGRVKGLAGVSEPRVYSENDNRVIVELAGVKDPAKALDMIRSTASLEFYHLKNIKSPRNSLAVWTMDQPGTAGQPYIFTNARGETIDSIKDPKGVLDKVVDIKNNPPILTGKDLIANAKSSMDPQGKITINIEFNDKGTEIFRDFTRKNVGEYLAVFFDGKLLTAPTINEPIPGGKAEINGFRSLEEARQKADFLNAGALPVPLKVISNDTVEASLGNETINQVLHAGIFGLLLVIIFMMLYYRLPGFIASLALGLYAVFNIAVFKVAHVSMSLAGLSALIIAIGMAVDANILIFERLKEELRSGKTLYAAIDAGFNRAFTAIFDSNMCTAITCAILMSFNSPSVQSFAFTLLVGVAISMFTAITVTRTFLHMLVGMKWAQNPNLYGLSKGWIHTVSFDIIGKKAYYFIFSAILILPGLFVLFTSGLRPGIEFKSGTTVQAVFKQPAEVADIQNIVDKFTPDSEVQLTSGKKGAFIKTTLISEKSDFNQKLSDMCKALDAKYGIETRDPQGAPIFASINSVGPSISKELTASAIKGVIIASIAIILYLAFRFAIGGFAAGLKYGTCAVLALIHDTSFILGLFAILGKVLKWEVDSLFVTAVLTIIGFSVHDTIVVFDRIRENLRHRLRGESYEELCNRSILQTLSRSINTSFTVVLTICMLIAFGGPLLRHFYIALLAGIVIGTYSSIFNATPLIVVWDYLGNKNKDAKKKSFEDKPMVDKPMVSPGVVMPAEETDEKKTDNETKSVESADSAKPSARIKRKKKRF